MYRSFLSLAVIFGLVVFASVSSANALTPQPGHYRGSASGGGHLTFDLTGNGEIVNLEIRGHSVGSYVAAKIHEHHAFRFDHRALPTGRYSGHGVWFESARCHGDFRRYESRHSDTNSYHTWHAHLTSQPMGADI
jgi:hypothetical protein